MSVNQAVNLNLSTNIVPPVLKMVQNDSNSRYIVASLWDGASAYDVGSASVMLRFTKPDGTGGMYDADEVGNVVDVDGNVVTIPVAAQVLTVAGDVFAQVDIYGSSNSKLASFAFKIDVAASVYPDAQLISSDYYNVLTATIANAVTAAQNAAASATAAAQSAKEAATSVDGAVKYNAPQTLTDAQKAQARANINAPAPYTAGDGIAISGSVIAAKVQPCNRNLLDNWYFGAPVNQRGKTVYSGTGLTVDRWQARSAQCYATVGDGVLQLEESGTGTRVYYQQKLEWPVTEAATLSVLTGPVVGACSAYVMTAAGTDPGIGMTLKANTLNVLTVSTKDIGAVGFGVPDGGRIDLKAVKLELGGVSTLAHQEPDGSWAVNKIPDWAEMLWKCQRYLQLYTTAAARPGKAADCRPVMSGEPVQSTLSIDGVTYYANSMGI